MKHVISFLLMAAISVLGGSAFMLQSGGPSSPPPPTPCFQGPAFTGQVPTPAKAAGFTTCVLNADFSTSTTDANGINWSNTATYIDVCGATQQFKFNVQWDAGAGPTTGPCGNLTITTDSGFQVLHQAYSVADSQNGARLLALTWPSLYGDSNPAHSLPFMHYAEITARIPLAGLTQNGQGFIVWAWWDRSQPNGPPQPSGNLENDMIELNADTFVSGQGANSNTSFVDWPTKAGNTGFGPYKFDPTSYHKLAVLTTNDGVSTSVGYCLYIDDVKFGCKTGTATGGDGKLTQHIDQIVNWIGCNGCTGEIVNPIDIYIQSVRVWDCANWQTTPCSGPLVNSQNERGVTTKFAWLGGAVDAVMAWLLPPAAAAQLRADSVSR